MPEKILRLARFREAHPEIGRTVRREDFGYWHATVRLADGRMWYPAEDDLGKLLDKLDAHLARPG
jgi:hypothetical protein